MFSPWGTRFDAATTGTAKATVTSGSRLKAALLAALLLLTVLVAGCSSNSQEPATGETTEPTQSAEQPQEAAAEWTVELLPEYPEDAVPLYEVKLLDTAYYSVRNDPQWAAVEGGLRNIYHSVWESNVPASDVLEHYRQLCDSVDAEGTNGEQLSGTCGEYEIFLNTGFHNDKNMAYLSVDLPKSSVSETNKFFGDYPEGIVELPESFKIFEETYYRTLFTANDMSYMRHFDIADLDGDGQADLQGDARFNYFEERYGDKEAFEIDREYLTITWTDGEYDIKVAFMPDFDRGSLTVGYDYVPE